MARRNKRGSIVEELISPKTFIDLRMQGLSFAMIAERIGITKYSLYNLYKKYKSNRYDGYLPIDPDAIRRELQEDIPFYKIAYMHNLEAPGLRNFMDDYDIEDRLTPERVKAVFSAAPTRTYAYEYFGLNRITLEKYIKEHDIDV